MRGLWRGSLSALLNCTRDRLEGSPPSRRSLAQRGAVSLRTQLLLTMVTLVVATAGSVAWVVHRRIADAVIPTALRSLVEEARGMAHELDGDLAAAAEDAVLLAFSDDVRRLGEALGRGERAQGSLDRVAALCRTLLAAKPDYFQARIIGSGDGGREIVRAERTGPGGPVVIVPERDLQAKGDRAYVSEAFAVDSGATYVSPVELNYEFGQVDPRRIPVLRVARQVRTTAGVAVAIAIINVDMRPAFGRLRALAGDDSRIYLVDSAGRYLLHPDSTREYGTDLGTRHTWHDDFPMLIDVLRHGSSATAVQGPFGQVAVAAVSAHPAGGPAVTIIKTKPVTAIQQQVAVVGRAALVGGGVVAAVAIGIAFVLARRVSAPVLAMAHAVGSAEGSVPRVPEDVPGELGTLAKALNRLGEEIAQKRAALEQEVGHRRAAEASLLQEAERLRLLSAIVESSEDAILTKSLDGTITSWNLAAEQLYGYTEAEVVGRPVSLIVPDDQRQELDRLLAQLRNGESIRYLETVRLTKDGRRLDVSVSLSPLFSAQGQPIGAASIGRDITERKIAEERFRLAIEASPNGILLVDGRGLIQLANEEAAQMFGYARDGLAGQAVEILIPERYRTGHPTLRQGFAASPERRPMGHGRDLYGRRIDGTEFPVEVGLTPIRTREGPMVLCAVVDISERRRTAEALESHRRELERSNAELGQFAYVASHDLREPLRMVASYTQLLAQRYQGQLDARADKYIRYAVEGATRMQQLVTDLLTYSRVDTRGREPQVTESESVVRRVLADLRPMVRETDAEITHDDLPPVMSDDVQLGQVFQNLIGNALKFRGDAPPRVHIGATIVGGLARFTIEDNGIGIDPQYAEQVFQMFQRLHERARYEGNGIGLAIAKKIVERHGGRIWFESTEGRGTAFYFTIPLAPAQRETAEAGSMRT